MPAHSIERGGVTAFLSAMTWADETGSRVVIWMDSAYYAVGLWPLWRLLESSDSLPYSSNTDTLPGACKKGG